MKTVFTMGFQDRGFWLGAGGAITKEERDQILRELSDADQMAQSVHPWTKALKPEDDAKFEDLKKKAFDLSPTVYEISNKLSPGNPVKWILSDQEKALISAYVDMMGRLYEMATGKPFVSTAPPLSPAQAPAGGAPGAPSSGTGPSSTTILLAAGGAVAVMIGAALLLK